MKEEDKKTTIILSKKTRLILLALGIKGETYDTIIQRLIKNYKK